MIYDPTPVTPALPVPVKHSHHHQHQHQHQKQEQAKIVNNVEVSIPYTQIPIYLSEGKQIGLLSVVRKEDQGCSGYNYEAEETSIQLY